MRARAASGVELSLGAAKQLLAQQKGSDAPSANSANYAEEIAEEADDERHLVEWEDAPALKGLPLPPKVVALLAEAAALPDDERAVVFSQAM